MHGEMDMGRATRIRHGPDGTEAIFTVLAHPGTAIALEGMVDAALVPGTRVAVDAVRIALLDLDHASRFGLSTGVHHAPRDMDNLSDRLGGLPGDTHQIVVHIGRKRDGVEGAFCLSRSRDKLGCE